jgi:hypothetical protein
LPQSRREMRRTPSTSSADADGTNAHARNAKRERAKGAPTTRPRAQHSTAACPATMGAAVITGTRSAAPRARAHTDKQLGGVCIPVLQYWGPGPRHPAGIIYHHAPRRGGPSTFRSITKHAFSALREHPKQPAGRPASLKGRLQRPAPFSACHKAIRATSSILTALRWRHLNSASTELAPPPSPAELAPPQYCSAR